MPPGTLAFPFRIPFQNPQSGAFRTTGASLPPLLKEKSDSPASGSINGGVYFVSQKLLASLRVEPLSLERAVLPTLVLERCVKVFPTDAPFLDIGIPSDYAAASGFFEHLGIAPKSP